MKKLSNAGWCGLALAALLAGCASTKATDARIDDEQARALAAVGTSQFEIRWDGPLAGAKERGVMAVTDGSTTLTTRAGARVFIVHDKKAFPPREETAFAGTDAELQGIGRKFLQASGAVSAEVDDARVLRQFIQTGEAVPGGKEVRVGAVQASHRSLLVTRRIEGVEVVSSRLLLHVNSFGRIGFMELAWPDIDRETLARALRYKDWIARQPAVRQLEGAEVESVDAVVLHSPAVGFYNDSTAAIRIIYRPNAKQVGQKAVRYVDERGEDVTLPRDVDLPAEEKVQRSAIRK